MDGSCDRKLHPKNSPVRCNASLEQSHGPLDSFLPTADADPRNQDPHRLSYVNDEGTIPEPFRMSFKNLREYKGGYTAKQSLVTFFTAKKLP